MAHLWNSNFREAILIGRYNYKRWSANIKFVVGTKGFDFNSDNDNSNYGGDVFGDERERPSNTGITIGQGLKTDIFHAELQTEYLINPTSNLPLKTTHYGSTLVLEQICLTGILIFNL